MLELDLAMSLLLPGYVVPICISLLLAVSFSVTAHLRTSSQRRQYYFLQSITLLGAIFGAKLSVLFGDYHWPWTPVNDWSQVLWSGRSITGALIFGFLFAEIAKPLIGYAMPPNDRFATLLPFTVGIGRIGCLIAGCCGGLPFGGWCALRGADGVARYPTQLIEMVFQFAVGALFIFLLKRGILFGRLFALYLILYGAFRFGTEFIRDTPKWFGGFSGYQLLSVFMVGLGAAFLTKRTLAQPGSWADFKPVAAPVEARLD
jgi:phosphatidylglycerol:prolipoprotein diacylglycerol transferase